jgi:hypothetical protein
MPTPRSKSEPVSGNRIHHGAVMTATSRPMTVSGAGVRRLSMQPTLPPLDTANAVSLEFG